MPSKNVYHENKKDMLQETLRMHTSAFKTFLENPKYSQTHRQQAFAKRQSINKTYSHKGLAEVQLNHTFKEDQLKLLFKALKETEQHNLTQLRK